MLSVCTECCRYAPALATTCAHAASGPVQANTGQGCTRKSAEIIGLFCVMKSQTNESNIHFVYATQQHLCCCRACAVCRAGQGCIYREKLTRLSAKFSAEENPLINLFLWPDTKLKIYQLTISLVCTAHHTVQCRKNTWEWQGLSLSKLMQLKSNFMRQVRETRSRVGYHLQIYVFT